MMSKTRCGFDRICALLSLVVCFVVPPTSSTAQPLPEVLLAFDGQALMPVVVSPEATPSLREAAEELANYLGRISGGKFRVEDAAVASGIAVGQKAIVVGLVSSFTDLPFEIDFPSGTTSRDQYVLRTTGNGLYLLGTTPAAVECAVWDFLHRQGYRLFFLTDNWEIVPDRPEMTAAVNVIEQPDYVTRQAPRGAPWSDRDLWHRWQKRNRMNSSFGLSTGHAYGGIVRRNQKTFDEHPEYFSLVRGARTRGANAKFCVSNTGLRQIVVDDAVREMKAQPELDSISMDPSDGGGWCECEACRAMGSVSDRALTLANDVAAAINDLGLGEKYVGMYGYNEHSPPPNITAHPKVVISVATSFIRGGYSVEELVSGWQAQDAVPGIRDYHDVFAWSHDLPRSARGGNIDYLIRTIPWFHKHGARFMNSENMDSWGANGLGYWLTPQLLWDIGNADHVDALVEDFLDNAFDAAKEPMRAFYQLINHDHDSVRSHQDVVARMYRSLDQARKMTSDLQVRARLDDLVLYTHYLELYGQYRNADGKARQQEFEKVWRHAYRMRDRMMLSTVALCDRDRFRDRTVQVPDDASEWKSNEPFDEATISELLASGIAVNTPTVLNFEAKKYSEDLVPATQLNLPHVSPGRYDDRGRGRQQIYTWLPENRRQIELKVTGGLIRHYRDRGNVRFSLYSPKDVTLDAIDDDDSVPPDGEQRRIELTSIYSGLHRLEWTDGSDMTQVVFPADLPLTIRSTLEDPMRLGGRWDLYFYVPHGTTVVGGYTDSTKGSMLDGHNTVVLDFGTMKAAGYFSVPVPEGQDGTLWKFSDSRGSRMLMTVPPYLATSDESLLLPREIVESDKKQVLNDKKTSLLRVTRPKDLPGILLDDTSAENTDQRVETPGQPSATGQTFLWDGSSNVPAAVELNDLEAVEFYVIKEHEPEVDEFDWLHGVALAFHGDRLFASYGHNYGKENTASEVANYSVSIDGGQNWSPPGLIDDGQEENLAVSHGVFLGVAGKLWAFHGAFYGRMQGTHTRAYSFDAATNIWTPHGAVVADGFWPMQQPQRMADGNWMMAGLQVIDGIGKANNPAAVAISRGDDLLKWDLVSIPKPPNMSMWGESTVIVDGPDLLNICRYRRPIALVSTSHDFGRTWTTLAESNLPMAASKPYAGVLSTGQRYLIGNTTADNENRRWPLTIAVSDPRGHQFLRMYRIRDATHNGPGESHTSAALSYPYAIEHNGKLYVGYSNNGGRGGNRNSAELAIISVESLTPDK